MAKLFYSPQLSLSLEEAVVRQQNGEKNGEDHHLGSVILVTKNLYDFIFRKLEENKSIQATLKRIVSKKLFSEWKERFPSVVVMIPHDTIKIIPCIKSINGDDITVALPIYINGATGKQTEELLTHLLNGIELQVESNEILVTITIKTRGCFDLPAI